MSYTPGIVVFSSSAFISRYPEFAGVSVGLLQQYFNEATLYLNNEIASPVPDPIVRALYLNMLTAHIGALNCTRDPSGNFVAGAGGNGLVGKIASATEGSVSVNTNLSSGSTVSQGWYQQTQYGATYYAAMAKFRTAIYLRRLRGAQCGWGYGNNGGGYCGF